MASTKRSNAGRHLNRTVDLLEKAQEELIKYIKATEAEEQPTRLWVATRNLDLAKLAVLRADLEMECDDRVTFNRVLKDARST